MEKIELHIVAMNHAESSPGNYVIVLEDAAKTKRLPIIIGVTEAQAIAIFLEKIPTPRPLTHDLYTATLAALKSTLKEVFIHSNLEESFISSLIIINAADEEIKIDSRTSDALALAVRCNAGITISRQLFEKYAFQSVEKRSLLIGPLLAYSMAELEIMLQDYLAKEDYEKAARVRDVIRKKGSKKK